MLQHLIQENSQTGNEIHLLNILRCNIIYVKKQCLRKLRIYFFISADLNDPQQQTSINM